MLCPVKQQRRIFGFDFDYITPYILYLWLQYNLLACVELSFLQLSCPYEV